MWESRFFLFFLFFFIRARLTRAFDHHFLVAWELNFQIEASVTRAHIILPMLASCFETAPDQTSNSNTRMCWYYSVSYLISSFLVAIPKMNVVNVYIKKSIILESEVCILTVEHFLSQASIKTTLHCSGCGSYYKLVYRIQGKEY